jgi:gliding motility-associated lipoprotein GldH
MCAKKLSGFIVVVAMLVGVHSCVNIDVFEKNVSIPDQEWSSSFRPEIKFEITDTTSLYNIYVVLRHTNAYRYNNIWLNIYTHSPAADSVHKERVDLRLATDDKGWLGSGMDDIFEHRILVNRGQPLRFPRSGEYAFRIEQIMREEPLQYVMNVGIRVEKVKP